MIFKSPLISVGSGKLAGNVITRGRGNSLVMRKLSVPVNPRSTFQTANRSKLAALAGVWATGLSNAQRLAWKSYADAVTVINKLGDAIHLSAISMYVRCNQLRVTAGYDRIDNAPAIQTLGTPFAPLPNVWKATTPFGIDATGIVVPEFGTSGALLIGVSHPQSATRTSPPGTFVDMTQIDASLWGDTDPNFPTALTLAQLEAAIGTLTEGQRIFVRIAAAYDDGRCSNYVISPLDVGAVS
ncbi:MAG: hypothetical protein ACREFF_07770 [Candidatus Udaeobacter sp.]